MHPPRTGRFNDSLFFVMDGRPLVFRMAPRSDQGFLFYEVGMMAQEPEIHSLVQAHTSVPVPKILLYDDSGRIAPRPYLIMERLPGTPFSQSVGTSTDDVYRQVGRHLRQVHGITRDRFGYLGAHHPTAACETWGEAFEVMWNRLLDDIFAWDGYTRAQADRFRTLLDRDRALFERHIPSSLLHMDVWAENILVDNSGQVTGIIDWDRVLWGDPEIEFAVLDYCGVSIPSFWEGYGADRDTSPPARRRGLYYYLYEIQKYIVIERGRRNNIAVADQYRWQAMRIADRM